MRIWCFGSINHDYVYAVDHMVLPGETILSSRRQVFLGGKGLNQAIALARAGAKVSLAGALGEEEDESVLAFLASEGIETKGVEKIPGTLTGHAIIQLDASGQNSILLYPGANHAISKAHRQRALAQGRPGDFLVLQNELNDLEELLEEGFRRGLRVCLNPSPVTSSLEALPLERLAYLILNEAEGAHLTKKQEPQEILEALAGRCPNGHIVLTLGERGALYAHQKERLSQGAVSVQAVDTTGAGDTFTGYFLAAVSRGDCVPEALKQSAHAAALAVMRPGAARSIPRAAEVDAFFTEQRRR
ncbi:Ribokinase [Clostridiaceae bacterium JG1575]|nr:Ribokinase [Clostridiaceae bacterium JG1575]